MQCCQPSSLPLKINQVPLTLPSLSLALTCQFVESKVEHTDAQVRRSSEREFEMEVTVLHPTPTHTARCHCCKLSNLVILRGRRSMTVL